LVIFLFQFSPKDKNEKQLDKILPYLEVKCKNR